MNLVFRVKASVGRGMGARGSGLFAIAAYLGCGFSGSRVRDLGFGS